MKSVYTLSPVMGEILTTLLERMEQEEIPELVGELSPQVRKIAFLIDLLNTPPSPPPPPPMEELPPLLLTAYLKNGKVGEPYSVPLPLEGVTHITLQQDGESGLLWDEEQGLLRGTPGKKGDYKIILHGQQYDRGVEITAHLAVLADPRSLWVAIASDVNDPCWKADQAFDSFAGDLFCLAASKRGRSHARNGTMRDDDFAFHKALPGGWQVVAVADGAGSAQLSRRGSHVVVQTMVGQLPGLLEEHFGEDLPALVAEYGQQGESAAHAIKVRLYQTLTTAAWRAVVALEKEAEVLKLSPNDLATTLVCCIAKPLEKGWFIAAFAVGDSGAALLDLANQKVTVLTLADGGEFAGQTRFLQRGEFANSEDIFKRLTFTVAQQFTALVLMTDGISDAKFPTEVAFADPGLWTIFWQEDLSAAVELSAANTELEYQLLNWLDFWSPGNHDDRTIALLLP